MTLKTLETTPPLARARVPIAFAVGALAAMLVAGCTSVGPREAPIAPAPAPSAPTVPRNAEPPPPKVNLSGFPLPYRQGYADGCASAGGVEHKDAARFSSDMNYRTGWTDGRALCTKK